MHILKVHGPNLRGPFDTRFDTHLLDDPSQAEIEDGYLTVRLPAYPGRVEEGRGGRRIPARRATGPITITYAPGQWTKTTVYEQGEYPS